MPNWKKLIVSGSDASLSTLTITTSGSTDDSLLLTATDDSSTAAPVATFKRNSSSPGDADYLGQLKFKGENDADQEVVYAKITAKINDASDGSEDGLIEIANKRGGLNVITARFNAEKFQLLNGTDLEVDGTSSLQDVQIDSLGVGTAASSTTGEIRATGDITAYYSSDERLKENIKPIENATDKVKALGGYTFDWKEGIEEVTSKTGKDVGIIAQELEKVLPELVNTRENGYKGVDYPKLVALLVESNKQLILRVEVLENKL